MDGANKHILIIDDEKDICFLLSSMLKRKHYTVSFVNTLGDGFEYLSSSSVKPFLVFMDINLPDGSGLNHISQIKTLYPNTKIILISAYDSDLEKNTASEHGADLFLAKPFNKELVYKALDDVLTPQDAG
jgi:two-component system, OmpR family, response regulator